MKTTVVLSAVALAVFAAPAVAKSRTQQHTTPALAHQSSADIQRGQAFGTDPDPQIRFELRRDGSSSWEAVGAGSQ
jgi:hypothetical protein